MKVTKLLLKCCFIYLMIHIVTMIGPYNQPSNQQKNKSLNSGTSAEGRKMMRGDITKELQLGKRFRRKVPVTKSIYTPGHNWPRPNLCPDYGKGVRLLILIMSSPSNFAARMLIRNSWGFYQMQNDVVIAFVLGLSNTNRVDTVSLLGEASLYGDLIRRNFWDTRDNLPLKVLSMFEWMQKYCSNARFLLKTDDDVFVNVNRLLAHINQQKDEPCQRAIYGYCKTNEIPGRDKEHQYPVSYEEFPYEVYPKYLSGPAYLIPRCIVGELLAGTLRQKYLKIEDVLITGIVAASINVKPIEFNNVFIENYTTTNCYLHIALYHHGVASQLEMWKEVLDTKKKCAIKQDVQTTLLEILDRAMTNQTSYNYSSKLCTEAPKLLVLVASRSDHFTSRQAIRQTWGHYALRKDLEIAFFHDARDVTNNITKQYLRAEEQVYGDLVQGNDQSYINSTSKIISMLNWAKEHCQRSKYLLITIENVFINLRGVLKLIHCIRYPNTRVWRLQRSMALEFDLSGRESKYRSFFQGLSLDPPHLISSGAISQALQQSKHEMMSRFVEFKKPPLTNTKGLIFYTTSYAEQLYWWGKYG